LETKKDTTKWKDKLIPILEDGSVYWDGPHKGAVYFPGGHGYSNDWRTTTGAGKVTWTKNDVFKAALKFDGAFHGAREQTHFIFKNVGSSATYVMRNEDLEYCIANGVLIHGVILGRWRFMHRGNRYSIVPEELISTIELEKEE